MIPFDVVDFFSKVHSIDFTLKHFEYGGEDIEMNISVFALLVKRCDSLDLKCVHFNSRNKKNDRRR